MTSRSVHPEPDFVRLGTGLVGQELADALGLPTALVADLVTWLPSHTAPTEPLVTDLLALPGVPRDPSTQDTPIARTEPGFAVYFAEYTALAKAAAVVSGFGFNTEDTAWLRGFGVAAGWLDPTALPLVVAATPAGGYARWRRLADAAAVKAALPADGTPYTSLMDLARGGASRSTYLAALSARTGWAVADLDPVSAPLAYPVDFTAERALARRYGQPIKDWF